MRFASLRFRAFLSVLRRTPFDTATPEGRSSERYRRIVLTTLANGLARSASISVGVVTVPLALGHLGKEQYGIFTTVTGFVAWVGLFDLGILNGLVNRVAEADGRDDRASAAAYASSAFFLLLGIALLLSVIGVAALPIVPWQSVFAAGGAIPGSRLTWSVAAAFGCVVAAMPLSIVRQIYAGYQRAYVGALFTMVGAAFTLAGLFVAVNAGASMPVLVLAFSGGATVAAAANLAFMLAREMPWMRPSIRRVSVVAFRRLVSTSLPMFLYQMGALLVNETQALVLAHRAGLSVVADWSIVWRVYVMVVSLIAMGTASFVPPFREAHERGDREWLARSFRRMLALRSALVLGASTILLAGGNALLRLWLRRSDVQFGPSTWVCVAAMCLIAVWVSCFVDLLNIMDRVWPQVWFVLAQGAATVVLTAVLGRRYGVTGALVAMFLPGVFVSGVFAPRLARKLLLDVASPRAPEVSTFTIHE